MIAVVDENGRSAGNVPFGEAVEVRAPADPSHMSGPESRAVQRDLAVPQIIL